MARGHTLQSVIPADWVERIDAIKDDAVTRSVWVKGAIELRLARDEAAARLSAGDLPSWERDLLSDPARGHPAATGLGWPHPMAEVSLDDDAPYPCREDERHGYGRDA